MFFCQVSSNMYALEWGAPFGIARAASASRISPDPIHFRWCKFCFEKVRGLVSLVFALLKFPVGWTEEEYDDDIMCHVLLSQNFLTKSDLGSLGALCYWFNIGRKARFSMVFPQKLGEQSMW